MVRQEVVVRVGQSVAEPAEPLDGFQPVSCAAARLAHCAAKTDQPLAGRSRAVDGEGGKPGVERRDERLAEVGGFAERGALIEPADRIEQRVGHRSFASAVAVDKGVGRSRQRRPRRQIVKVAEPVLALIL